MPAHESSKKEIAINVEILTGAPDKRGRYGRYGGKFVPETLMVAMEELEAAYLEYRQDEEFQRELDFLLSTYVGRRTPLYFAATLTRELGGAKIYLKREDLAHTGAHKPRWIGSWRGLVGVA